MSSFFHFLNRCPFQLLVLILVKLYRHTHLVSYIIFDINDTEIDDRHFFSYYYITFKVTKDYTFFQYLTTF